MENLVHILKLFKKYNWFYFIKTSLCKNIFRKLLGVAAILSVILSMIAYNHSQLCSASLFLFFISLSLIIFRLIDKDHESSINQPLTMKFLNHNYLILRIHAIKEALQKEDNYHDYFLDKVIKECDTYLILEANGTSFILKHPLIIVPISIISSYFGNLLWANKNTTITNFIVISFTFLIFRIFPLVENKFAKVRTVQFILKTLRNQMKQNLESTTFDFWQIRYIKVNKDMDRGAIKI